MEYGPYEYVLVSVRDHIATVTLNRPEVRNAATLEVTMELEQIFRKITGDDDVRAVVVTGTGEAFSAGGDIKAMDRRVKEGTRLPHAMRSAGVTRRLWEAMLSVEQPIIAAINGDAMGLGCNIALFCDITCIADDAKIGDTHTKVGLVAGDGGAVMFPLLLGYARGKEFLMRGTVVKGAEAERIGLVNHSYPKDQVLDEATKIAQELADLPLWAVRWTKLSVNKAIRDQFNLVFDVSISYEMLSMCDEPHAEAVRAFVEKRKPKFY